MERKGGKQEKLFICPLCGGAKYLGWLWTNICWLCKGAGVVSDNKLFR